MKPILRPQSTMEYLNIILECKILLFYYFGRCSWLLISCGDYAIVFSWSLHWHRQYLDVMKSLNGSRIQIWWCTCKQSSKGRRDDYLLSRNIIDFGDGLHGNVWHAWWTFYGGGWAMKMEWAKRSIFSIVEKQIMRLYFICLFACFVGIHKLKDMNSLWGSICYGRYKQFQGLLLLHHFNIWTWWNRYMPWLVKFIWMDGLI